MTQRVIDRTLRAMPLDLSLMFVSASAITVALVLAIALRTASHLTRRPRSH